MHPAALTGTILLCVSLMVLTAVLLVAYKPAYA